MGTEGHGDLDRLLGVVLLLLLLLLLGHVELLVVVVAAAVSDLRIRTFENSFVDDDEFHTRSINTVSQSLLAVGCSFFFFFSSFVLSSHLFACSWFALWYLSWGSKTAAAAAVVVRVGTVVVVAPVGRDGVVKMRPEREL